MNLIPTWVYPAGLAVAALVGAAIGAGAATVIKDGEIAELRRSQAQASERAATQNVVRLQTAQARGDALTSDLLAVQARADQLQEQLHDALQKSTSGRACLGGGALRVLDRAALGIRADLPASPGSPAAADAADVATDTQVAGWAADANHRYAECARRLAALIQFAEETP